MMNFHILNNCFHSISFYYSLLQNLKQWLKKPKMLPSHKESDLHFRGPDQSHLREEKEVDQDLATENAKDHAQEKEEGTEGKQAFLEKRAPDFRQYPWLP